jgi:thymidylate synthase (FAD)
MEHTVRVLDHGFVRLDAAMADDLSVVNAARVSFARRRETMEEADEGLVRFLMRERHGTPFEHNAFRFHIRCPIFVAREWFRHRVGCLTGDARVTFVNHKGSTSPKHSQTMEELWTLWSSGQRDGHAPSEQKLEEVRTLLSRGLSRRAVSSRAGVGRRLVRRIAAGDALGRRDARRRVRKMRVRVLNEETSEFTVGCIDEVVDKGVQPVYRVRLADGKTLTMTENHQVLTSDGWHTMRAALGLTGSGPGACMSARCHLLVNGVELHRSEDWLRRQREAGKSIREMARAAGRSSHTVRKWLRIHRLGFEPGETAVRLGHLRPDDLAEVPARRGTKLAAHAVEVVSIEYVGERQTYDLCIAGPWHNFVANGVVVHNSFNEFSMRYAKATDEFYVPAPEDVRTQVGKPGSYTFEPVDPELAESTRRDLQEVYDHAYATYERLVEAGVAREVARSALPVGSYTEFYWTVNARSLMNFLSLRNHANAQLEIRRYAEALEQFLAEHMPITYEAFVANDRRSP